MKVGPEGPTYGLAITVFESLLLMNPFKFRSTK
jgi:hypothetical protein